MADCALSTPDSEIHEIAGSSPPGTGRPVFRPTPPPRPRPQTKPRLDGDAEIIDLAGRVVALAARENKATGWVGTIEDYITFKGPQHPMCDDRRPGARGKVREMALPDLRATLARELPHDPPSEWIADIQQSIARMEAYHDAVLALEKRFDLARVEKRRSRMFRRLIRWATRLTAMAPVTHAGLKAKAEAQLAVDRAGNFDNWTQELAGSVGRDVVRIMEVETQAAMPTLATEHSCTSEEAAELDFQPWTGDCPVPPNSEWNDAGAAHLPILRFAWLFMSSSKDDLMKHFAGMLTEQREEFEEVCCSLLDSEQFFKDMHSLAAAASARTFVALNSMQFDARYKHLVEVDSAAATEAA